MFKERVKTSIIIILILNLCVLTYHMWFKSGILGSDWPQFSFGDLPFVRMFSGDDSVSVPKENLSKARKAVINDGGFWYPYYNTDEGFDTLNEKTTDILKSLLAGKANEEKNISYEQWLGYLTSPSVYVEYPIEVTPQMLAMVLNSSYEKIDNISLLKDVIIIPRGNDGVSVAVRDIRTNAAKEFYIENEDLSFPVEVLLMYTERYPRDGYYEFAFSALMGQTELGDGNVKVGDLVLFSDNDSAYGDIYASNPLSDYEYEKLLKSFSFSPNPLRHYPDDYGAENYVENFATVRIFPDGYIEYNAVQPEKGVDLGHNGINQYEDINSVIDFAEKVWKSVSDQPLNVLVSDIEKTQYGSKITFDYYYSGREIAIGIGGEGRERVSHAIEVETYQGKIISYRQYLRNYTRAESVTLQENFNLALDYFVELFESFGDCTITDLYLGYFDDGRSQGVLKTTWLGEINHSHEAYPKR